MLSKWFFICHTVLALNNFTAQWVKRIKNKTKVIVEFNLISTVFITFVLY